MHQRHFGHHGPGRRRLVGRPFPSREDLLERLESYQRDVEQELANLEDVIRHLRGTGGGSAPSGPAEA